MFSSSFCFTLMLSTLAGADDKLTRTAEDVRKAATAPNRGDEGRPLPLFASWNTGGVGDGFTPTWQLAMLKQGHHLLPWFGFERPDSQLEPHQLQTLEECRRLGLPLVFISTQWEHFLTTDKKLFALPPEENANVVGNDGVVQRRISPFGAVAPWRGVGERWGSAPICQICVSSLAIRLTT